MKTTNWKAIGHKLGVLSLTALMIASCGSNSDENKTSNSTSTISGNSPIFGDSSTGTDGTTWANLKSQTACSQGRGSDRTFHVTQYSNLQQGSTSGTQQASYYGKNVNGDLIFINKVNNGGTIAYNVVFSFCNYSDGYATYIGDNANMTNFYLLNTVITNDGSCSYGEVDKATLYFYNQALVGSRDFPSGTAAIEFAGVCTF